MGKATWEGMYPKGISDRGHSFKSNRHLIVDRIENNKLFILR